MKEALPVRLGALLVLNLSMSGFSVTPGSGSHKSLLQRGSHRGGGAVERGAASRGEAVTLKAENPLVPVKKMFDLSGQDRPQLQGHFLTNSELTPINSIACLQAKQANPAVNCDSHNVPKLAEGASWAGMLNAGNFPSYEDPVCQSNGEFLCDPHDVLDNKTRMALAEELQKLRESSPITCGQYTERTVDPVHYQPFYLGVVILNQWPMSQSSPDYLQQLGQVVARQWNMDKLYVGSPIPYLRCPNTGMLFIFPEIDQVYLSTESCRFVCGSKGGPEVTTAAVAALQGSGGAYGAAIAGIKTLYSFLLKTESPQIDGSGHIVNSESGPTGKVTYGPVKSGVLDKLAEDGEKRGSTYTELGLRVLFVLSFVLLCFSLAIALLMFLLTPEISKRSMKR